MRKKTYIIFALALFSKVGWAADTRTCELTTPRNPDNWPKNRIDFDINLPLIREYQRVLNYGSSGYQEIPVDLVDEAHASGYSIPIRACKLETSSDATSESISYLCEGVNGSPIYSTQGYLFWDRLANKGYYRIEVWPAQGYHIEPSEFKFENCQ